MWLRVVTEGEDPEEVPEVPDMDQGQAVTFPEWLDKFSEKFKTYSNREIKNVALVCNFTEAEIDAVLPKEDSRRVA